MNTLNKSLAFLLFLCLISLDNYAQKYAVSEISPELLENANAVIRLDETKYTIEDLFHANSQNHLVMTILNNKATRHAKMTIPYDLSSKVKSVTAKIYNAQGVLIKTIKKDEIIDAAYSTYSLFQDDRYKYLDLTEKTLPYTVDFEYVMEYKNLFYINDFQTLFDDQISLEKSTHIIIAPKELNPKFKILNHDSAPVIEETDGKIKTVFSFNNLKAEEKEAYGSSVFRNSPKVLLAPQTFDFDGYKGGFETWEKFNNWMLDLIKDRTELTPEIINAIKTMTKDAKTDEEKIRIIYNYLQQNTRYVSIQLGIGGFQPFPAQSVYDLGYGDCKALSNYTYTLLKALDIKSHHVLVDAGSSPRKILRDFPNSTFNHMILCVPNYGDTLWLECTSQTNPFAYQGRFTGDRDVFLITEEGGKIVHTNIYVKEDNLQIRHAQVKLNKEGFGNAIIKTHYKGLQYENNNIDYYVKQSPEEQKKWTLEHTDVPSFDLVNFSFEVKKDKIPSINQTLEVNLKNYAQSSGERLFIPLNLMNKHDQVPPRMTNRKTDIEFQVAWIDIDSIIYEIPETLHPEFIPTDISISNQFGEYESQVKVENGKLIYIRKMGTNKGIFPKESYEELRNFYKEIKKADGAKIVYLKST